MRVVPQIAAVLAAATLLTWPYSATVGGEDPPDIWTALRTQSFGDRPNAEEDGTVLLDAPVTALNATVVPLPVHIPPSVKGRPKSLTLFIDQTPDPKIATLTFGPTGGMEASGSSTPA